MSLAARVRDRTLFAYGRCRARLGFPLTVRGTRRPAGAPASSDTTAIIDDLVAAHFHDQPLHINLSSMRDALRCLGGRPAVILETGASAWGTNSTMLWDRYVERFGGEVWTVDIRPTPGRMLGPLVTTNTCVTCDDSVPFLASWRRRHPTRRVDLVYFDSWDLDADAPLPAARHCIAEFAAIAPALGVGSLLLVDDTPAGPEWLPENLRAAATRHAERHGCYPGKGMLLTQLLAARPEFELVHHRYQVLYRRVG